MAKFPRQKITEKEKLAKPKDGTKSWGEQCIDAVIENSTFHGGKSKKQIAALYEMYNGVIKNELYEHLTNPYNSSNPKYKKYPAKIRSYNIIKPVIDLLIGEKSKQPFHYSVICTNSDVQIKAEDAKQQVIYNILQQQFINELNESGMETGIESQETPDVSEVIKEFDRSYKDNRAIIGQQSLDYLYHNLNLRDEFQEGFLDWLVSGEVYSYKGVSYNDVEYEIVNPLDIDYYAPPNVKFIEHAQWICRKSIDTPNGVIDKFRSYLTEKEIDKLEDPHSYDDIVDMIVPQHKNTDTAHKEIGIYHCVWKSFRKVVFLTYIDELGETQSMIVDETFKIDDPETQMVELEWITQYWQGYKIGRDIYLNIGPTEVPRNNLNNISISRAPYNGRIYSNRNAPNVSAVMLGMPYQILYNIFHYKLELSIAKHKDNIILMEINTIPKRHGWDEEKFMYYADANGFAFIDSTATGKSGERVTFNQFQVLNSQLGDYISKMFDLLNFVKQEWEDVLGISRQRKGNTLASDAVGNNERAVFQSSIMTEEIFRKYDNFLEKELNGLLDTSKIAWAGGKKATYLNSEYKQIFLEIEELQYAESEYSVFVTKSSEEAEKLETLKQFALQFAQNGSRPSTIAEILDAKNFIGIKNKLQEIEKIEQEMAAQQQEAEAAAQERIEQMKIEDREDMQIHQMEVEELKADTAIYIKELDVASKEEGFDLDKFNLEREKITADKEITREELRVKERIADKQNASREKIEKIKAQNKPKPTKK
ncbi:MAG: hypothetical protein EOM21_17985 [Gammaproteobacteria bacterium]|nr:hypothetical protein [Gammaproteobacteria bacterium]